MSDWAQAPPPRCARRYPGQVRAAPVLCCISCVAGMFCGGRCGRRAYGAALSACRRSAVEQMLVWSGDPGRNVLAVVGSRNFRPFKR